MNITQLIEDLEEIRELHGNIEVRWAAQPNWPFAYSIGGIVVDNDEEFEAEDNGTPEEMEEPIAYIGEGHQLEYLNGSVKTILENHGIW